MNSAYVFLAQHSIAKASACTILNYVIIYKADAPSLVVQGLLGVFSIVNVVMARTFGEKGVSTFRQTRSDKGNMRYHPSGV